MRLFVCSNIAALAISTMAAAEPRQESSQNTIKVHTTLVTLTATVLDDKGWQVIGLRKEDFSVLEDNVPREISLVGVDER